MLILTQQDLQRLLTMREVIDAVEDGFRAIAGGQAQSPDRLVLNLDDNSVLLEMPSYISAPGASRALGTKVVSVFSRNARYGLDNVQAMYLLLDAETGAPRALMEGRFITAIRTAATSALATKYMAAEGPKLLGIFGAGVQARFHIRAMIDVSEVKEILIASRNQPVDSDKAQLLAREMRDRYSIPCSVAPGEDVASRSNLICTCTSSPVPLFDGKLLKSGAHVNAVGAFTPETRELDTEAIKRSRVIVDALSAAGREAGEILIPLSKGAIGPEHVRGTLADLVSGAVSGRSAPDEITIFKSCGLAIEDLVTARLAYEKARRAQLGVDFGI